MRKRFFKSLTAVTLIILFTFIFLNDGIIKVVKNAFNYTISTFTNGGLSNNNKYEMSLKLDDEKRILSGTEKVTYFNGSKKAFEEIYFHIYPNAFSKDGAVPVMFNDSSYAYPGGFNPCYIDIMNIEVDGKKINYSVSGVDNTILKLKLKKPVKRNQHIQILMDFKLKIPESRDRIGYYNGSYIFGNWYPIAAVYDDTGWNIDEFYHIGDPFYSDSSDYRVNITLPDKYIIASTGDIINDKTEEGKRTVSIDAKSVRDFTWAANSNFKTYSMVVDGINLKCYFMNSNSEKINRAMETVKNAIKTFNEEFGRYPYKSYSIVESYFPTGMEYPGIVLIPGSYFNDDKSMLGLEGVIVHETAHQWWYGVVGNNEIDEAWLDEGLATYSKVLYFENVYGVSFGKDYFKKNISSVYESKRKGIKGKEIILKPLNRFEGWREYDTLVYKKGAVIFDVIRNKVGDEKFFAILKRYFNENKFKNANTKCFINVVEKMTNKKWDAFFNEWLLG